jgi:hypothetical protein
MPALGETIWDQALARHMYDAGATFEAIGANVGVLANVVSQFAKRHWPPPSPAAIRMQRSRERRREGKRTIPCDISTAQIEALASAGFLDRAMRDDAVEVAHGVGRMIDHLTRSVLTPGA